MKGMKRKNSYLQHMQRICPLKAPLFSRNSVNFLFQCFLNTKIIYIWLRIAKSPRVDFFYMLCKNSLHVSNPFTNLLQMHLIYRLIQNTVNVDTLYWKVQHDELLMKDHQLSQGIVKFKSRSEADICSDKETFFFSYLKAWKKTCLHLDTALPHKRFRSKYIWGRKEIH